MFEKSLCLNKSLKAGHIIAFDDLDAKKPSGYGIDARFFHAVIGKKILCDAQQWQFLTKDMIGD